jgi:hypothetical protein
MMQQSSGSALRFPVRARKAPYVAALVVAALASVEAPPGRAAGLNPLPAVAKALATVTSYQVVVTSASSGAPRRPSGTPIPGTRRGTRPGGGLGFFGFGRQTRTIVAVRKGALYEDYIVTKGTDRSGKPVTTGLIIYGNRVCTQAAGAHSYTCQTPTNQFAFSLDPTVAFTEGAGSTTFTRAGSKTVGGQACSGYAYLNQSPTVTGKGVIYLSAKTSLPCEQDASLTRHPSAGGTFTQTTTSIWSRFNDKSLTVPALPA